MFGQKIIRRQLLFREFNIFTINYVIWKKDLKEMKFQNLIRVIKLFKIREFQILFKNVKFEIFYTFNFMFYSLSWF